MVDHMQQQVEREKKRLGGMVEHLKVSEENRQILLNSINFPSSAFFKRKQSPEYDSTNFHKNQNIQKLEAESSANTFVNRTFKEDERPPFTYATLIRQVTVY